MVVVAGTGSIAYGEAADGAVVRVGGHGAVLGDVGSGSSLGLGALRHTANAYDGSETRGALAAAVITELKLKRAGDIQGRIQHPNLDMPLIASLAPLVDIAAKSGDLSAKALIQAEGSALAANAKRLARSIRQESALPALLIGSIFSGFPDIRDAVKAALRETGPVVILESSESVLGAARIALDLMPSRST
jgi:N-acetylglucosamine kinase-like BadF-type ATPase